MDKKWIAALLGAGVLLLSACGQGGGTAYYVGDRYAEVQFDSDRDGKQDRLLLISLD